jgi:GT2 family glycosyltransferase
MMRATAFAAVGGFDAGLIAGEEPELCVRLRASCWEIWRIDAEMTLHDAAITHFGQWWKRTRRAGHAFAEGAALHGQPPERHAVRETRSAVVWGLALPAAVMLGMILFGPWALLALLVWPAQLVRLAPRLGLTRTVFLMLGKTPEALGVVEYWWRRMTGTRRGLIEYK